MQAKLSFVPEARVAFSINQVITGESSVAIFTPRVTYKHLIKTATTRNCGQGIALGLRLDTISKNGLTNVFVGTSFDQMEGQSSSSIELTAMKER